MQIVGGVLYFILALFGPLNFLPMALFMVGGILALFTAQQKTGGGTDIPAVTS